MDLRETIKTPDPQVRYLVAGGRVIKLIRNEKGHWEDEEGTEFAFSEYGASVDDKVRAGIGIFSLPTWHELSHAARGHDYQYSSPVYQAYNTRKEADAYLKKCIELVPGWGNHTVTPQVFHFLARRFGASFWENETTND